jgi:hypothetical protein
MAAANKRSYFRTDTCLHKSPYINKKNASYCIVNKMLKDENVPKIINLSIKYYKVYRY